MATFELHIPFGMRNQVFESRPNFDGSLVVFSDSAQVPANETTSKGFDEFKMNLEAGTQIVEIGGMYY